ncbi:oxidoreductase of aldo/keto reductase family subgroup 1 [Lactiplantibacillus plantarum]|uniref:aldo/keto reductase n=1 Tax=Lactiplantibacillus plantarum TaxID=1590 RepID=UPI0001B002D4|nr:aldo/keto reductase [Lactiplantibacillus plantarum]ACT61094.1 oxidoreductase [Lactiplantibacillus plantarum JDM1]AHN67886.1 Oxidoreductase [Lactiplantibacillus plantarum DOMLa]ATQ32324.1 aldo/keto reductase [Lactiplantibacillus plantarum]KZU33137.1 oxidoreductase of aldo/keto reductase family subgroup 1 [Lactiplantibacillus plantarum]KZU65581.1 oxidoreductase of aldo/keto reductase family subgroup 1 [Lactiplantibacillus plantarum]
METYTLRDGLTVPKIGFGTYKLNGAHGVQVIDSAIDRGYRLLDTAFNYENEGAVGEAVRRSSVPRSELLISSKLPGRHHTYTEAINTIQESLYRAGLDYYDLYLIHWPNPKEDHYVEAWQALIDAQKLGLIRSIGVSNFLPEHLERLNKETGVLPVINQVELHPYFNQQAQRDYDQAHGVLTQDWSPLGRASEMLQNETLKEIAAHYHKNVGQLILRWELQLGTLPIPKSSTPSRQAGNMDVFDFEISAADMATINGLSQVDGRLNNQDPAVYQEF